MNNLNLDDEMKSFYSKHQGGSGPVIVAEVYHDDNPNKCVGFGIFSSIEKAHEWSESFDDNFTVLHLPYVVDVPEYGNEVLQ